MALDGVALVDSHFARVPYMTTTQAHRVKKLFAQYDLRNCLELGFMHGKSSTFIAAILREMGGGHLTSIDRPSAKALDPNIETMLARCGLNEYVDVFYEETSYNWKLLEFLEQNPRPSFDFCYIDGGHTWERDGFAFHLVEKLLRSGGWVLFDDLDHSFQKTYAQRGRIPPGGEVPKGAGMTQREFATQQIRKVWDLLVKEHPSFHNFIDEGRWGFAQKR